MFRTQTIFLSILLAFAGCVADPVADEPSDLFETVAGVVVVNEGLWRMDDASLTFYDPVEGRTIDDWFATVNPGERIGDTGNEVMVRGDRLYVVMSESATIEVIALPSGASLGRVRLPAGSSPRAVAFADDTTAWVSCLDEDAVYRWNPVSLALGERVEAGPAPEGMAVGAGRLFVANSGLGALRANEEGAGEVYVYDEITGQRVGAIEVGGNLQDLWSLPRTGRIYGFVGTVLPDTTGGEIIEIDPISLRITRRARTPGAWTATFDPTAAEAWVVSHTGIYVTSLLPDGLLEDPLTPELFRASTFSTLTEEVPHSIGIDPRTGEIYLGIARGYFQAPGRVDRYGRGGVFLGSFMTGLNPVGIVFF